MLLNKMEDCGKEHMSDENILCLGRLLQDHYHHDARRGHRLEVVSNNGSMVNVAL
jgi:hypothetical protein